MSVNNFLGRLEKMVTGMKAKNQKTRLKRIKLGDKKNVYSKGELLKKMPTYAGSTKVRKMQRDKFEIQKRNMVISG
jgi:hypothetical protein